MGLLLHSTGGSFLVLAHGPKTAAQAGQHRGTQMPLHGADAEWERQGPGDGLRHMGCLCAVLSPRTLCEFRSSPGLSCLLGASLYSPHRSQHWSGKAGVAVGLINSLFYTWIFSHCTPMCIPPC